MNRWWGTGAFSALVVLFHALPAAAAGPVLLVSIDGLMPEAYLQPDRLGLAVPNLRALVREGCWARGARSVVPSITFPAHTSMITGMNPSRHGVLSNEVFDPDGQLGGGWNWYASDVKVPTLFDRARAAGFKSAAVTWPASAGAPIDLNLPDMYPVASLRDARNLLGLARVGAGAAVLAEVLPDPASLIRLRDAIRVPVALRFLRERPDLMVVHFLELDDAQHAFGPRSPQAVAMTERLDAHLGTLFDELRAQGRWDDTTVVLVSDHGFAPIEHEVRVGVLLRAMGLFDVDGQGRLTTWRAFFWPQGGSAAIYLHAQASAQDRRRVDDVIAMLASNPEYGVARVFRGAEVAALGGLPGAHAVLDARAGFTFGRSFDGPGLVVARTGGTHGHHPGRPEARASFVIRGPGVHRNRDLGLVRLVDVAPTVAYVLGTDMGKVEGRVLLEAFTRAGRGRAAPAPPAAIPRSTSLSSGANGR
jgi:predicted AlkP superfamily pyrophosphatase or phosphodiesterase